MRGAIEKRAELILTCLAIAALAFTISWNESHLFRGLFMDDAYISMRHAKNFAEGEGLVYNPGERVEGYTNFSLTALLVIPYALHFDPVAFLKAQGLISGVVVLLSTGALTRRLAGAPAALVVMFAIALDQRFGWFCCAGMETVMVGALYVPALLLLDRRRLVPAALLFVLATMTRMETGLLFAVATLFLAHRARALSPNLSRLRVIAPFALTYVIGYGVYYAWRTIYYGWPFPNTYYAKVGGFATGWHRGLEYVSTSLRDMRAEPAALALVLPLPIIIVLAIRARSHARGRGLPALVLASLAVYLVFIISVGGDHFRERFIYHLYPLLLASVAWSVRAVAQRVRIPRPALIASAALVLLLGPIARSPVLLGGTDGVAAWQATGAFIRERAAPGQVIATDAAGVIALESGLPTVDLLGLTDAHIAHLPVEIGAGVAGHEKSDPAYVLAREPAFVTSWIDSDGHVGRGLRAHYRFWTELEPVAVVRRDGRADSMVDRLHRFDVEPTPEELAKWRDGRGPIAGRHDWAVWSRRTHPPPPRPFGRLDLGTQLPGALDHEGSLVYAPEGHAPSHVMFGPGMIFPEGTYRVRYRIRVESEHARAADTPLCHFDVWDGVAASHEQTLRAGEWLNRTRELALMLDVTASTASRPHELRLHCEGLATVVVEQGDISPSTPRLEVRPHDGELSGNQMLGD